MKVPNNTFASSFVLKSEKPQRKGINYCSKHAVKMQWVVHKCLTGSVDLTLNLLTTTIVAPPSNASKWQMGFNSAFKGLKRVEAKQRSCYWRFLIRRVSYTTSTLPTGKQLRRNSTWRSCDVCVNQIAEKTGKMAGWRLDPATRQCDRTHFTSCAAVFGRTRHRSVAAAAILTRSRTV